MRWWRWLQRLGPVALAFSGVATAVHALPVTLEDGAAIVVIDPAAPEGLSPWTVDGVVHQVPLAADRRSASTTIKVPVDRSGWLLLRARGDKPAYPTLDVYPYATTSPVYLTVAGRPARSPEDARYFVSWIDRMRASVEKHKDWNTDAERQETLDLLAQARAEYERRSRE